MHSPLFQTSRVLHFEIQRRLGSHLSAKAMAQEGINLTNYIKYARNSIVTGLWITLVYVQLENILLSFYKH
jgi:hypothetical protein